MIKTITALSLLAASAICYADSPCPTDFSCQVDSNGHAQCSQLPSGWSALTGQASSTGIINGSNAALNQVTWNNGALVCHYQDSATYTIIDLQGSTQLRPDTSDNYGWYWTNSSKTTAQCLAKAACVIS